MFSRSRFATALAGLGLLAVIPLVLGFLGALHPFFDSFAHFRLHLAVLVGIAALPLLATRFRLEAVVALALAFGAFATAQNFGATRLATAQAASPGEAPQALAAYRLLHLNLRHDNPTPGRVLSLIGREKPDVVTLNEVSPSWRPKLELIAGAYPHQLVCPTQKPFGGVAILSRRPFANPAAGRCDREGRLAVAPVDFGGRAIDIGAIHLDWPWPFSQSEQIERFSPGLAALSETAIVAGDFNAVPWSAAASTVAVAGGLSVLGGIGPTWLHRLLPASLRPWIGLPIDQVLAKGRIAAIAARTGDDAGSDHSPVIVTFTPMETPTPPGSLHASR